ncbi:MAG: GNAT family N-acetyltransferase [Clostridia bacterium]|nr:GNAT family N-acetyltransferase [Clostridia bacterium]
MEYSIIALRDRQDLKERAANWFHSKWRVPVEAYLDSMSENDGNKAGVPQWYLALSPEGEILGGLGVIENDFHKRKDLAPNIAAVYVEEKARRRGISRALLDFACEELRRFGRENAYLITTHTDYYEHCGFEFFAMVEEDDGGLARMYRRKLK